jgi:hypothetical protein
LIDHPEEPMPILEGSNKLISSDIVHMDKEFTFRYEAETGNIGMNIGVAAPMAIFPRAR